MQSMIEQPICAKEAAQYLGIHEQSLYRLIRKGQIPCAHRLGRSRYFFKSELQALIKER